MDAAPEPAAILMILRPVLIGAGSATVRVARHPVVPPDSRRFSRIAAYRSRQFNSEPRPPVRLTDVKLPLDHSEPGLRAAIKLKGRPFEFRWVRGTSATYHMK